jgi:uncharacterized membrane protein
MYLADSPGPGGYGFLIFVIFVLAAIVIFIAMVRSMRRMRAHVDRGDFGVDKRSRPRRGGPPPGE